MPVKGGGQAHLLRCEDMAGVLPCGLGWFPGRPRGKIPNKTTLAEEAHAFEGGLHRRVGSVEAEIPGDAIWARESLPGWQVLFKPSGLPSEAGYACPWLFERVTGFEPANTCLGIGRLSVHPCPLLFPGFPR
jgi:hypothetical protein